MNHTSHNEVNKGIREKGNRNCLATKGSFKNKGLKEKRTNIFSSLYGIFYTPLSGLFNPLRSITYNKRTNEISPCGRNDGRFARKNGGRWGGGFAAASLSLHTINGMASFTCGEIAALSSTAGRNLVIIDYLFFLWTSRNDRRFVRKRWSSLTRKIPFVNENDTFVKKNKIFEKSFSFLRVNSWTM